jgi:hypothetical protein
MKKKLFMFKKIIIDLLTLFSQKPVYRISTNLHSDILEYPFIFNEKEISSGKKQRLIHSFDEDGIPLIKSYIDVQDDDLHYYPITIGQVGLSVYQTYLASGNSVDKKRFLKFVDWFICNKKDDETGIFWLTHVPKPEYKVFSPWKSAFTQSRAISILLRGYHLTKREDVLKIIYGALKVYEIPIQKKGISVIIDNEASFYEEYTASEPTMVLDGHIFSLFGLLDILKYKSHLPQEITSLSQLIFSKGINGLKQKLPEFDLGFWLRFNLCKMEHYPAIDPCTTGYFKIVIEQLKVLEIFLADDSLKKYRLSFEKYLTIKNIFKSYKVKFKALKKLNRL